LKVLDAAVKHYGNVFIEGETQRYATPRLQV